MKSISTAGVNHILSLLDSGKDGYAAARSAGVSPSTVSRIHKKHCSSLQKFLGGHPAKLSPANIHHAQHLIYSGKAKNASQLTNPLANIINQPLYMNCLSYPEESWHGGCKEAKKAFSQ